MGCVVDSCSNCGKLNVCSLEVGCDECRRRMLGRRDLYIFVKRVEKSVNSYRASREKNIRQGKRREGNNAGRKRKSRV